MRFLHRMTAACGALLLVATCGTGLPLARADDVTVVPALAPQWAGPRIMRDFTVAGTPVQGASKAEDAPLLAPGQYTDISRSSSSGKADKYYKVRRTWPASTLRVSIIGRMSAADLSGSAGRGGWKYELTPSGSEVLCSQYSDLGLDTGKMGIIVGRTLLALPVDPMLPTPGADAKACGEASEFLVRVGRDMGVGGETQIEIRVIEESPAENVDQLPPGIQKVPKNNSDELTSPASGDPQPVVGGSSFNDAVELGAGTYSTEVLPGEIVLFKTTVQYGQSGFLSLDGIELSPEVAQAASEGISGSYAPMVYAPDLSRMNSQESLGPYRFRAHGDNSQMIKTPVINEIPEVRYRNRWESPRMYDNQSRGFSMAGYYYYAVGLGDYDFLQAKPVTFRFSIGVSGDVSGEPTSTLAPQSTSQDGTSPNQADAFPERWLLLAGGGALVLVGGGGMAYALLRRRH